MTAKKDAIVDFEFEEVQDEAPETIIENFTSNVLDPNARSISFNPCDLHGTLRVVAFEIKAPRDYLKGSTFGLCTIPQSEVRILGALSRINFNLSCKSAKLGWVKFKKRTAGFIEGKVDGFGEVKEVNGVQSFLEHLPTQTIKTDSLNGVTLVCTVDGKGKQGDSIEGYLVYVKT